MNKENLIALVMITCSCSMAQAQEYIDDELRNLTSIAQSEDGLEYRDIEYACENLGVESDWEEFFVNAMADGGFAIHEDEYEFPDWLTL